MFKFNLKDLLWFITVIGLAIVMVGKARENAELRTSLDKEKQLVEELIERDNDFKKIILSLHEQKAALKSQLEKDSRQ